LRRVQHNQKKMLIRIVTSCTGEKTVNHDQQLTLADFEQGPTHVAVRETELGTLLTPAIDLYNGLQHQRLQRGLRTVESNRGSERNLDRLGWLRTHFGQSEGGPI
jgi:hypothetical protein